MRVVIFTLDLTLTRVQLELQSSDRHAPGSIIARLFYCLRRLANSTQLTQRVRQAAVEALHLGQTVWHPTYLR